jgi:hypothetical protein
MAGGHLSWGIGEVGDVALDPSPPQRVGEDLAQDRVDVADRAWRQAARPVAPAGGQ